MPQPTTFSDYPSTQADAVIPPARTPPVSNPGAPNSQANVDPNAPETTPNPEQQRQDQEQDYIKNLLFDFSQAKPRLMKLRGMWTKEINDTIERRLYRKVDISPKQMREQGKLKPDETIVPLRVIDTNIRRENPAYVNYLISPARQYVFECLDNQAVDSQTSRNLEKDVTTLLRYPSWELPHFKCMDGAQLHAWDAVEVTYDDTKPGKIGLEHIGHDNLIFGIDTIDNQACEVLLRRYSVSVMQLRNWIIQYGFDPHQTQYCLDTAKGLDKIDFNFTIWKVYIKWQGVVYIAWCCFEFCDGWLKAPEKLKMGISKQIPVQKMQEVPNPQFNPVAHGIGNALGLTQVPPTIQQPTTVMEWQEQDIVDYPIFINVYLINEEQPIMQAVGRGFLDKYKQEAMTAIATGYVNALMRSSNLIGSVAGDPSSTAEPQQYKTPLNNGAIYDREIKFTSLPSPDPQHLTSLEFFATQNTEETGQVAIAAQNRLDSRKTAKEVEGAEQTQAQLSTVQVALYSIFLTKLGNFQWLILQSQAMQDKIPLLQIAQVNLDPLTQQQTTTMINNKDLIKLRYIVKPAGSVDVVERQKMLSQMRQDWPVVQQTPLAIEFFKEFIRQAYPNQANSWISIMDQSQQTKQLVQKLGQMLEYLAKKDQKDLSPQDINTLKGVEQEVQQFLQPQAPVQQGQQPAQQSFGQGSRTPVPDSNTIPTQQHQ